jgi:hypothetical protein
MRFAVLIWIALLGLAAEVREPKLRHELLRREAKDQAAREATLRFLERYGRNLRQEGSISKWDLPPQIGKAYIRLVHRVMAIDRGNQAWLARALDRHGWPGRSLVGRDGADAAWLIAQHADRDVGFQGRCVEMMARMPLDEVDQALMANLTDRNAVNAKRNQIYDTQWELRDGRLVPSTPIEDEAHVDARRGARGLNPIRDYVADLRKKAGLASDER